MFCIKVTKWIYYKKVKKANFVVHKTEDKDKNWAPYVCCVSCNATLFQWTRGNKNSMPFAVPMVWDMPGIHFDDCYFSYEHRSILEKTKT